MDEKHQLLIDSLIRANNLVGINPTQDEADPIFVVIMIAVLIIITGSSIYLFFGPSRSWNRGQFPKILRYSVKNVHEAMMYLGLELIRRDDSKALKSQLQTLAWYLEKKFTGPQQDHFEDLVNSMKYRVKIQTVLDWLKRKMPQAHRIQVLDFVTDFAFSNGDITDLEVQFIQYVAQELAIERADVDMIFHIRLQQHRAENKRTTNQHTGTANREHAIDEALEALGLTKNSTWEEVRKRYRELAKKMHPDRFAALGKQEQQTANERFTAITQAYQTLESRMKKDV